MPTVNPTGFCPRCNEYVLLARERIDTCLAIILLIFTAGIGLIIYLIWYYSKPEDTCVHCGTKITVSQSQNQFAYQSQPQNLQRPYAVPAAIGVAEEITGDMPNFCSLCGEKLEAGVKYCPNCGGKI
ncbi:MAG: zinc-ribbon domain-containing protein [Promethearchaeota archaeon]